jgi:hypothetical protein
MSLYEVCRRRRVHGHTGEVERTWDMRGMVGRDHMLENSLKGVWEPSRGYQTPWLRTYTCTGRAIATINAVCPKSGAYNPIFESYISMTLSHMNSA